MKIVFVGGESKNWDTWSRVSPIYYWPVVLINRRSSLIYNSVQKLRSAWIGQTIDVEEWKRKRVAKFSFITRPQKSSAGNLSVFYVLSLIENKRTPDTNLQITLQQLLTAKPPTSQLSSPESVDTCRWSPMRQLKWRPLARAALQETFF